MGPRKVPSPGCICLVLGCFFAWKTLLLSRGTHDMARLGVFAAAVMKTSLGTTLQCGVFEENRLRKDAFNKLCLRGTLLSLSQTVFCIKIRLQSSWICALLWDV